MFTYKFIAIPLTGETNTIKNLSVKEITANNDDDARNKFKAQYRLFFFARIRILNHE